MSEHPFEDVAAGSFYEKATLWAVEHGITRGVSTGLPSANQCGMDFGMDVVFTDVVSGCTKKVDDSGAFNGLCYHVFTDANRLFSS